MPTQRGSIPTPIPGVPQTPRHFAASGRLQRPSSLEAVQTQTTSSTARSVWWLVHGKEGEEGGGEEQRVRKEGDGLTGTTQFTDPLKPTE